MTGRVAVVGSVNVDLVMRVARLPLPGETVIGGVFSRAPGGKGANAAAAAAALGARTSLVGLVGADDLGASAREALEAAGVDCSSLGVASEATGTAFVVVDDDAENLIAVASGANEQLSAGHVEDALSDLPAGAVVLANLEVPDAAVLAGARAARARGARFVLNPAPARPLADDLLAACDVLVPNAGEAALLGLGSPQELVERTGAAVVVTRGREGAELYRPGAEVVHQPAFDVEVADTTGAGDAFSAALAWALSTGHDLPAAVRAGAAAGALATRGLGARASLASAEEVEALLAVS